MKNDTSASRGVLCSGRCQRRSTWPTMFCRYSGNGNSTPSVLTVATSDPVEGVSRQGRGLRRGARRRLALGIVRGLGRRGRGHGALGRLFRLGERRRFLLSRPLQRLGRLARLFLGRRGGDEPHLVGGRRGAARLAGCGEQKQARGTVHQQRGGERQADVRRDALPPPHRSTYSGSATRPTAPTPDCRITANT